MGLTVDYKFALTAKETLTGIAGASASTIDYSQFDVSGRLTDTSTPAASKGCYTSLALTGSSSGTLDLTNLPGPLSSVITALGLKLRFIRITSLAESVGTFTITEGASNGYAGVEYTVGPGECVKQYFKDRLGAVASGDKTLDYTHTGNATIQLTLIFG